jgi:hypothetical protein
MRGRARASLKPSGPTGTKSPLVCLIQSGRFHAERSGQCLGTKFCVSPVPSTNGAGAHSSGLSATALHDLPRWSCALKKIYWTRKTEVASLFPLYINHIPW